MFFSVNIGCLEGGGFEGCFEGRLRLRGTRNFCNGEVVAVLTVIFEVDVLGEKLEVTLEVVAFDSLKDDVLIF